MTKRRINVAPKKGRSRRSRPLAFLSGVFHDLLFGSYAADVWIIITFTLLAPAMTLQNLEWITISARIGVTTLAGILLVVLFRHVRHLREYPSSVSVSTSETPLMSIQATIEPEEEEEQDTRRLLPHEILSLFRDTHYSRKDNVRKRFEGSSVQWELRFNHIGLLVSGQWLVYLSTSAIPVTSTESVICQIDPEKIDKIRWFKRGDLVTAKGIIQRIDPLSIELNFASIVTSET